MQIKNIQIKNYRNYDECNLDFPAQKTILIGKNAQGKTNLLESINYLASLSSSRASNDSELIKWGSDFARIKAEIVKNDTDITLEVILNPPKRKQLKVNGIKKTKLGEFTGNLLVVSFGVSDLLLLRGAPQDRRHWLDDCISKIYPAYSERLAKYNKVRVQRNNLLKEFNCNINLADYQIALLESFDDQLVVAGSNLIYLRQKYLKEINEIATQKHKIISDGDELLIKYNSTITEKFDAQKDEVMTPEQIAQEYKQKIILKRNEEVIRAQTVIGPHRDDVLFYINFIDAKSYASQGQQRTVVLSLKLGELDFIKQKTGENPVLLLDDVLAELDQSRQNYLLNSIGDEIQTVITSVDVMGFDKEYLKDVKVCKIIAGSLA